MAHNIEAVADIYTNPYVLFSIYHDTNHLSWCTLLLPNSSDLLKMCNFFVFRTTSSSTIVAVAIFFVYHMEMLFKFVPFALCVQEAKHGKKEMREWRERKKTDKQSSILFLWSIISLVSTSEKPLKAKTHSRCSVFFSLILSAPIVVVHFVQSVTIFNGRTRICSCIYFFGWERAAQNSAWYINMVLVFCLVFARIFASN